MEEFKRGELPGRYTAKVLYRWDNKKFEDKCLKKWEKNWEKWKRKTMWGGKASSSGVEILKGG